MGFDNKAKTSRKTEVWAVVLFALMGWFFWGLANQKPMTEAEISDSYKQMREVEQKKQEAQAYKDHINRMSGK